MTRTPGRSPTDVPVPEAGGGPRVAGPQPRPQREARATAQIQGRARRGLREGGGGEERMLQAPGDPRRPRGQPLPVPLRQEVHVGAGPPVLQAADQPERPAVPLPVHDQERGQAAEIQLRGRVPDDLRHLRRGGDGGRGGRPGGRRREGLHGEGADAVPGRRPAEARTAGEGQRLEAHQGRALRAPRGPRDPDHRRRGGCGPAAQAPQRFCHHLRRHRQDAGPGGGRGDAGRQH